MKKPYNLVSVLGFRTLQPWKYQNCIQKYKYSPNTITTKGFMVHSVFSLNIFIRRLCRHQIYTTAALYPSTDRYGDTSILKLKQYILSIQLTTVSDKGVELVGNCIWTLPRKFHRFGRCQETLWDRGSSTGLGRDAPSSFNLLHYDRLLNISSIPAVIEYRSKFEFS